MTFWQALIMTLLAFVVGVVLGYIARKREEHINTAIIYFDKNKNILGVEADGKEVARLEYNILNINPDDKIDIIKDEENNDED